MNTDSRYRTAKALLNQADDLLRQAEKLVEEDNEKFLISYAITAVSDAESHIYGKV